jgi:hypothetical protein
MSRRWFFLAGVFILFFFLLSLTLFLFFPDRINVENFNRIEEGMSEREVEEILGGIGKQISVVEVEDPINENVRKLVLKKWRGRNGSEITISFDSTLKVFGKGFRKPK